MNFEITRDQEFIKYCLTHPYVWRNTIDDALIGVDPDLFFPPMNGVVYVRAGEFGLFALCKENHITYDVHTILLPSARGFARTICKDGMEWAFKNIDMCLRVTTSVPSFNVRAIKLSIDVGMEFIGINKKSFLRDGVLFDQHLFGISKE